MADQSGTNRISKFFLPVFWIFGLIIFGISIAGIVESQYVFSVHLFVVVLVFIIFMGLISVMQVFLQKKSESNYNVEGGVVEGPAKDRGGKENKGYDTIEKNPTSKDAAAAKWVNNYVPYGDYPKGGEAYAREQETNAVNGSVQTYDGDEIDFKEVKVDDDEQEDSNKQEEEKK